MYPTKKRKSVDLEKGLKVIFNLKAQEEKSAVDEKEVKPDIHHFEEDKTNNIVQNSKKLGHQDLPNSSPGSSQHSETVVSQQLPHSSPGPSQPSKKVAYEDLPYYTAGLYPYNMNLSMDYYLAEPNQYAEIGDYQVFPDYTDGTHRHSRKVGNKAAEDLDVIVEFPHSPNLNEGRFSLNNIMSSSDSDSETMSSESMNDGVFVMIESRPPLDDAMIQIEGEELPASDGPATSNCEQKYSEENISEAYGIKEETFFVPEPMTPCTECLITCLHCIDSMCVIS